MEVQFLVSFLNLVGGESDENDDNDISSQKKVFKKYTSVDLFWKF